MMTTMTKRPLPLWLLRLYRSHRNPVQARPPAAKIALLDVYYDAVAAGIDHTSMSRL